MARKIGAKQRQIQNLSRAINKIDQSYMKSTIGLNHNVNNIKMGINDFTYTIDNVTKKVKYADINNLKDSEQAAILLNMAQIRTKLREEKALEQLKEKGKISKPMLRTLAKDESKLFENISEYNEITKDLSKEKIKESFDFDILDVEQELDDFFQIDDGNGLTGSDKQFDFYRPGENGGFNELNTFTMNVYRSLKR